MPIKPKSTIEITAKSFDKLWSCSIQITAPRPGEEASACVLLLPYNDFGEVSEADIQTLNIEGIMTKAQDASSNMAKAMYFLLAAIDDEFNAQQDNKNE